MGIGNQRNSTKNLITETYDSQASGYANYTQNSRDPWLERIKSQVIEHVSLIARDKKQTIVDLGCGTGELFSLLSSQSIDFKGVGIDISQEMLQQASINLASHECSFVHGDIENVPLDGRFADVIISLNAIHFCSELDCLGAEISRISSSGSHGDLVFLGNQDLMSEIRAEGFLAKLLDIGVSDDVVEAFRDFPSKADVDLLVKSSAISNVNIEEVLETYYLRSFSDLSLILETKYSFLKHGSVSSFDELRLYFFRHALSLSEPEGIPIQSHFFRVTW